MSCQGPFFGRGFVSLRGYNQRILSSADGAVLDLRSGLLLTQKWRHCLPTVKIEYNFFFFFSPPLWFRFLTSLICYKSLSFNMATQIFGSEYVDSRQWCDCFSFYLLLALLHDSVQLCCLLHWDWPQTLGSHQSPEEK